MITFVIALNTFREAVRDKILYVLIVFGVLLIFASKGIGFISIDPATGNKIMADMGLAAIWLFSGMVSIFVGTGLIYKEIDKRTIYTILSKPAERWQFLLGKYFGLTLTTLVNMLVLSAAFLTYFLWLNGAQVTGALVQSLGLTFIEMLVVTAVAIFFSAASTPILSAIFTTMIFFFGQLTQWVVDLADVLHGQAQSQGDAAIRRAEWVVAAMRTIYNVLPNLHNFNVRREAVLAEPGALALPWSQTGSVALYGIAYATALLLLAQLVFSRRNL